MLLMTIIRGLTLCSLYPTRQIQVGGIGVPFRWNVVFFYHNIIQFSHLKPILFRGFIYLGSIPFSLPNFVSNLVITYLPTCVPMTALHVIKPMARLNARLLFNPRSSSMSSAS